MDGLDLDDWPRIERENFLHYVSLARPGGAPHDARSLAARLLAALTAAFALDGRWVDRDQRLEAARVGEQQRRAAVLIEQVHQRCDPVTEWEAFTEALWAGRQWLFLEPAVR